MAKDAGDRFVVTLPAAGAQRARGVFSNSPNDLTATLIKVVSIFALVFFVVFKFIMNMAIVGGAIIPVLQGAVADRIGIHHAFFLPVLCYLYILYYALRGSMPNSERYVNGRANA